MTGQLRSGNVQKNGLSNINRIDFGPLSPSPTV